MSKKKLLPGFARFEFKPGIANFPGFKGMQRQLDPGALPPNQFWHLQNARILEGEVVSRGGSEPVNDNAEVGCITGLFDNLEPDSTPAPQEGLFIATNTPSGTTVRVGFWDGLTYDDRFEGDPNSGASVQTFLTYQENPVFTVGLKGYRIEENGSLTELFTLSAAAQDAIEGPDGNLYFIINSNTELIKWDGANFTLELDGLDYLGRLWVSDSDLYVGAEDSATPMILQQSASYSACSWSSPVPNGRPTSRGVNLFGKLWTGWVDTDSSGENYIVSVSGSTATTERNTGLHGGNAAKGVQGLAALGSLLVYGHNLDGPIATLGTYDGLSTWNDSVMDLSNTQPEIATNFIDDLTTFENELYVFEDGNSASPARDSNVIRCATVSGTWTADVVPAGKFNGNQDVPWTPLVSL